MTIKEFKEQCEYWLGCGYSSYATCTSDKDEVDKLIKIIRLIGEDVIVKVDELEKIHYKSITLKAIINHLEKGHEIVNISQKGKMS